MVSQSQEGDWESPSRTGSMLSLDGRQRPPTAKTPPSYYDAVRSRHSLSQPVNKSPESLKQEKSLHVQQVKYNSLPRPLPQRYPPAPANGQPLRNVWTEDHYDPTRSNGNALRSGSEHCGVRQHYDSPPKPANRVPLQLQVHQEKCSMKRGIEHAESSPQGFHVPRGMNAPRQHTEKLTVDCSPRGNAMDPRQKNSLHALPVRPDNRAPPPVPGRRPPQPRGATPNGIECSNNIQKRDNTQNSGLLRRCYPMSPNGSAPSPCGYPPPSRPAIDGSPNYEPRYSKSGKLCPRPLNQEPRPMPPPVVMLRTGPLGTYPDSDTLKRSEMASYTRHQDRNGTPSVDYERQYHSRAPPSQGDVSQQIFVDTNSYTNGQPVIADHLAIPYRIPQLSPKTPRGMFEGNQPGNGMNLRKEPLSLPCTRPQPSPALQNGSPSNDFKSRTLPAMSRTLSESASPSRSHRQEPLPNHFSDRGHLYETRNACPRPNLNRNSLPSDSRMVLHNNDRDVIYANQQLPIHPSNGISKDFSPDQHRTAPMLNGNGNPLYENSQPPVRNSLRGIQDSNEILYANHHIANTHYNNHQLPPSGLENKHGNISNTPYNNHQLPPSSLENKHGNIANTPYNNHQLPPSSLESKHGNTANTHYNNHQLPPSNFENKHGTKNPRSDRRNTHPPPPVAHKPTHTLPQPSEMVMITETRGWNGQASSTYTKDVVKPTPRMPRLPNGVLASSAQLATVPAYECVINEMSNHPLHHISPQTTNSSTLSLRSGYDSSSSSSRDYCRRPSKSDSGTELRRTSESSLISSQQIDKSLLSVSMTSLCSDASSSISSRPRQPHDDPAWDRMNEDNQKRKDKNSVFSASPWEREEKEKLHHEQVLDARRARDEEISYLESLGEGRSEKQSEWLRILRLEREFQRRAEQEPDDEEGSVCSDTSDTTDSDKIASFPRDKLTVIPNERIGLKLLDELLDNPTKNSTSSDKNITERELPLRSPSEKHFIPLDVAIPSNDLQPSSLPLANNILKISSDDGNENRISKPPVPAPRPSKAYIAIPLSKTQKSSETAIENEQISGMLNPDMDANVSSLTKLDISDSSAFFCSTENEDHSSRNSPQDNWLIEVPNKFQDREENEHRLKQNGAHIREETVTVEQKPKQNGAYILDEAAMMEQEEKNGTFSEQSRIYENIKPADYHFLRTQTVSASGYSSHTLPKSTTNSLSSKDPPKNTTRHFEKKFPAMGVSSTLTKKANGYVPCDADILPSLYASCKAQNGYVKDVPSDLVDKSPEFKKMWISRPEKLTFQDKIRKFSIQAGEDDVPRDRVKNSRAQREIEIKFSDAQKRAQKLAES